MLGASDAYYDWVIFVISTKIKEPYFTCQIDLMLTNMMKLCDVA